MANKPLLSTFLLRPTVLVPPRIPLKRILGSMRTAGSVRDGTPRRTRGSAADTSHNLESELVRCREIVHRNVCHAKGATGEGFLFVAVRTGLEGPGLSASQKISYCFTTVGGQYLWTCLQSFSAFRRWGDFEQRSVGRRIWL